MVLVTLDRPARLNALSFEMFDELRLLCGTLAEDRAARAVIVTGAGPGLALALMADLRIAAADATLTTAFVRIGLTGGDAGMSWLLPRLVGMTNASELLLTGTPIDVQRAERIGLLNRVFEPAELLGEARELARRIAANNPFGVRLTKQVLRQNADAPSLAAALETENRNQVLITRTEDMQEALLAFGEQRAAVWSDA